MAADGRDVFVAGQTEEIFGAAIPMKRMGTADELAALYADFRGKVMADENTWTLLTSEADLAGLPAGFVSAMAAAARERGLDAPDTMRVLRKEDPKFLTTGATYVADVDDPLLAGVAAVTYVRSTVAHASRAPTPTGGAPPPSPPAGNRAGVSTPVGPDAARHADNRALSPSPTPFRSRRVVFAQCRDRSLWRANWLQPMRAPFPNRPARRDVRYFRAQIAGGTAKRVASAA